MMPQSRELNCNWMIKKAVLTKEILINMLSLSCSGDLESKTLIRVRVNNMPLKDVIIEIKKIKLNFNKNAINCSELLKDF